MDFCSVGYIKVVCLQKYKTAFLLSFVKRWINSYYACNTKRLGLSVDDIQWGAHLGTAKAGNGTRTLTFNSHWSI